MKNDINIKRVAAFSKRLLQVCICILSSSHSCWYSPRERAETFISTHALTHIYIYLYVAMYACVEYQQNQNLGSVFLVSVWDS